MKAFKNNQLSKEGLGQVLRAFQASIEETKSKARLSPCKSRRSSILTTEEALDPLLL